MSGSDSERIDGLVCATVAWATDGDGECSGPVSMVQGTIEKIQYIPGEGDAQPDNGYDITLKDGDGLDVFGGAGVGLSDTTVSTVLMTGETPMLPVATTGLLTLEVLNAGAAHAGTVKVFFRR